MHIIKIWPWSEHNIWSDFIKRQLPAIHVTPLAAAYQRFSCFFSMFSSYFLVKLYLKSHWNPYSKSKYNVFHTFVDIARSLKIFFLCFSCFRWTQQLSPRLWFLFLFLYLCEILVLVIYLREWESHWKVSNLVAYWCTLLWFLWV